MSYVGRFAPSPTGWLHAGSMVAALASWLDARAHGGRWLVRIEDVDGPRCIAGAEDAILRQLADCGLHPDAPPLRQSDRGALYAQALERLHAAGLAYGCRCTRREIAQALQARGLDRERHGDLVYPGTCRPGGPQPVPWPEARAVRLLTCADDGRDTVIDWTDRRLGAQRQNLSREVGDFVLRRADGLWAYQLAVVVDDAAQGVTDIVRGEDLADNTPRQILLRRHLGLPQPRHLHTPLVLAADGQKLSKQNGAAPVDTGRPAEVLAAAARALGLDLAEGLSADAVRAEALRQWRLRLEQE
ncbi:tRNA glutamyl-Q(34) synthetase GluQRS [Sphaerotilus sulfidivorans]|uniref:Glutamyl-Q tRNA(Asp) synthetase n=1 Tax=Sphaerotilus sulfidivorans TaxID=639200 RepID=A0A5C1Q4V0_9BURK|nr:tRNA glutamyl-Q(34) synthetase GluQRS [Sphaerotilus sulfidivorans]QEN02517.1 tRNA glutamyl-Q(34) synthetase GluQRS [Sphaerotilus sulfidivorans]